MSEKRGPTLPALEGVLLLEQPLLHAPYDQLRRALRTQQRLTEHEFRHCHHALAPLRQSPGKHTSPAPLAGKTKHPRHHAPSYVPGGAADEPLADMSLMSDMSMDTSLDDPRGAAAAAAERRARTALAHARTGVPGTEDGPKLSPEAQAAAAASVSVRSALGRLKELRRKLEPISRQMLSTADAAKERVAHLEELHAILARAPTSSSVLVPAPARPSVAEENRDGDDPGEAFEHWTAQRLDRMLVDYLLREQYPRTAALLSQTRHLDGLVDRELFSEMDAVEATLMPAPADDRTGAVSKPASCATALAWCTENKAALKKAKSTLEFELRLQEYIELVRVRTPASLQQAISYARRHLVPYCEESELRSTVFRALGLLACDPTTHGDLYPEFGPDRWAGLRTKFRATALQIHSLPAQATLHLALSAGLSALKVPDCYGRGLRPRANPDCPVCAPDRLGQLATEVPWSHHVNSTLICRVTGRVMNDDDPPLVLPNGAVYSSSGIMELARASPPPGQVTDPASGVSFNVADARKMFIS